MIYAQQTGMFPRVVPSQVSAFPMQSTAMPAVYAQEGEGDLGINTDKLITLIITMMIMVMMMKMMTKATESIG